mgnify:CR=1 FL=1
MQMFQGVFSLRVSAVLDRVNMTIWKGTTMEKTMSRFMNLLSLLFTRVRYQPGHRAAQQDEGHAGHGDDEAVAKAGQKAHLGDAVDVVAKAAKVSAVGSLKTVEVVKVPSIFRLFCKIRTMG